MTYIAAKVKSLNSQGLDLSNEHRLASYLRAYWQARTERLALPSTLAGIDSEEQQNRLRPVLNPADHRDQVGQVIFSEANEIDQALARAEYAAPIWAVTPPAEQANCLLKAADLLESHSPALIALAIREAGKSYPNAIAELREAVDFLRYYANQVTRDFQIDTHPPLGPIVCISPWNFPLAIFLGQVGAALAAGNVVLAKPAEQTPLIASLAIKLLHQAGIPEDVVQLLPGEGDVGTQLVADRRIQGVMFTGCTTVAQHIASQLAERLNKAGRPIPLIAEARVASMP